MARYPYPLPRRYRRYRRDSMSPVQVAGAVAAAVVVLAAAGAHPHAAHGPATAGRGAVTRQVTAAGPMAARVAAFARAQLGKPYVWGAAGPDAYDCSGLAWAAYENAGLSWGRTTAAVMWATEPHVSTPDEGDLVFFAGSDGTPTAPGHVGIVVDPAKNIMVDAYATGYGVRTDTYGLPSSLGGLSDVVGFTDPAGA